MSKGPEVRKEPQCISISSVSTEKERNQLAKPREEVSKFLWLNPLKHVEADPKQFLDHSNLIDLQ
jgi:hypothetical protein